MSQLPLGKRHDCNAMPTKRLGHTLLINNINIDVNVITLLMSSPPVKGHENPSKGHCSEGGSRFPDNEDPKLFVEVLPPQILHSKTAYNFH